MSSADSRRFLMAVASLGLATSVAFAQSRPTSAPPPKVILGTVEAISGNVIYVNVGVQLIALSVHDDTEIWKGKALPDLSTVQPGDDITAQYRADALGRNVAASIRLNGVNFSAVITKTGGNAFEVFTNPNADPQSAYKQETKLVTVDGGTLFEESAREDLRVGRGVQVMGLDLKNGTVLAARVTVYEGNRPVRMKPGRVVLPNGQIR